MPVMELSVPAIHCDHCKMSIEGAVSALPGVAAVEVSIAERTVTVRYEDDGAQRADVVAAIEEQGYEVP